MTRKSLLFVLCILGYPSVLLANDYPTQARVEYVFGCMNTLGEQNYDNMYACVCAFDKLAHQVTYDRFVELQSLRTLIATPGEKGGAFRDVPGARKALSSFSDLQQELLGSCRIGVQAAK
ncbi:MAG: hypothetical protein ACPGSC_12205 [Granulosicoccaceae bacterium]